MIHADEYDAGFFYLLLLLVVNRVLSSKHDYFLVLSSHSQLINNPVRHPCIENVPKIINSVINGRCMHALRFNFPGHLIFQFFSLYISYACLFVHRFVKVVGENFVSLDYSTTIIMFNIQFGLRKITQAR